MNGRRLKATATRPAHGRGTARELSQLISVIFRGIVVPLLSLITLGIMGLVAPLMILGGERRQTLWDRMAGTVVRDDPDDVSLTY